MDNLNVQCRVCQNWESMEVESADYKNWQEGTLIQDTVREGTTALGQAAMPYLTTDQRELLISATCGTCWDDLFGGFGEEEEE